MRFKSEVIKGSVRHTRLVLTKLAANVCVAHIGRAIKSIGLDHFLKPAFIHIFYSGEKLV